MISAAAGRRNIARRVGARVGSWMVFPYFQVARVWSSVFLPSGVAGFLVLSFGFSGSA